VTTAALHFLGRLDWSHFPERPTHRLFPGPKPGPRAPFVAAFLPKLHRQLPSMGQLRTFLLEHPALFWLLGFPLHPDPRHPLGFDPHASLPCRQQFSRILRQLRPEQASFLLASTVHLLDQVLAPRLAQEGLPPLGQDISLDTKHIIAWVRENNPKELIPHRYDKTRQPKGDPDCRLGCKKKRNRKPTHDGSHRAPTQEGLPASQAPVGEFYWGYASGVVATIAGDWGEVVLAECTQTFDHADQSYFFPLMAQTEAHLGRSPKNGALDAAFDAFYVYDYFHDAGGMAAVPYAGRRDQRKTFDPDGLPLCPAQLAMPLKSTFHKKSHCLVPHDCGRYACPLLHPEPTGEACPFDHPKWPHGGCVTTLGLSDGARIRHQLDRKSPAYKRLYNQRSAIERINSRATALGIE